MNYTNNIVMLAIIASKIINIGISTGHNILYLQPKYHNIGDCLNFEI